MVVPFAKENTVYETSFEWSWNERFAVGQAQVWQLNDANVLELGKEVWAGHKSGCPSRRGEARERGGKPRSMHHRHRESVGFLKEAAERCILMRQKNDPGFDAWSFCSSSGRKSNFSVG